ncbi:MAG: hypothetical protein QUS11_06420 [Candidatus Fermentibacter sp.]|nr:hypothetical protein [Candidatus Fermentibacter sp.]
MSDSYDNALAERILGPIGNIPPIEFKNLHYQRKDLLAMAVGDT